jgi:hypothetical protein
MRDQRSTDPGSSRADVSATPVTLDRTLASWKPQSLLLLAVFGSTCGVLLLLLNVSGTDRSATFIASEGFLPWAGVVATQFGFWSVVSVSLWREVISTYRTTAPGKAIWLVPAVMVTALVGLALLSPARNVDWPLAWHQPKALIMTTAAAVGVGLPALFGMPIVADPVRRLPREGMTPQNIDGALTARAQIRRLLAVAGLAIGLAVLASAALHNATVPSFITEEAFPAIDVLLYGAFFSVLLIVVYVPAQLSLHRYCLDICDQFIPVATCHVQRVSSL